MRKLLMIFAVIFFPSTLFCHGGGTDRNGGHFDRTTGEYHYHHGNKAHQHINGECELNKNDNSSLYIDQNNNYHKETKENNWSKILIVGACALGLGYYLRRANNKSS